MPWSFLGYNGPRLKPPYGADQETIDKMTAASQVSRGKHYLPDLGATEAEFDLHLLWQHCMLNQILPENLTRLPRRAVEYIAAHSGDVVYVGIDRQGQEVERIPGRNLKLQENAKRAQLELERRDHRNGAWGTAIAAAIGGGAGTYVFSLI